MSSGENFVGNTCLAFGAREGIRLFRVDGGSGMERCGQGMILSKVAPVFKTGEAGQGVQGVGGRKIRVRHLPEKTFQGRDAEGHARRIENCGV